ncbi:MAG: phytanoyl-CoA dioxygenase family protein [Planctomycetota bacterium]|nr:phytanoyl-CoA dioxygenase family protein [Planctomycetota bacterium]
MNWTPTLSHLDEQGYAVVKGFLGRETTGAIRRYMDEILPPRQPKDLPNVPRLHTARHPITSPLMPMLASRPELLELAQATLRIPASEGFDSLRMLEQVLIRTDPAPANRGPTGWHVDMAFPPEQYESTPRRTYFHMVHACNTVPPGGGAFTIVPGSHKLNYAATAKAATPEDLATFKKDPVAVAGLDRDKGIEVLAEEGDLIIFNPMCLHSASANVSDVSRYVYFASFTHTSATWLRERLVEMKYDVPFPPGFREALPAHAKKLLDV